MTFDLPPEPARLLAVSGPPRLGRLFALRRTDLLPFAALTLAYAIAALAGLQWTVVQGVGAVIWPAAGVALAGLLLGGVRLWPAILIGRLLAAAAASSTLPGVSTLLIAAGAVAAAVLPTLLLQRRGAFDPMLASLRDLVWFAVAGGALGGLISAATGVAGLAAAGVPIHAMQPVFLTWILGFASGVMTVGALILVWSPREARRQTLASWGHFAICMAVAGVLIWLIFLRPSGMLRTWHIYPLLIWAAVAFNARGVSLILTLTSLAGIWAAVEGMGPLADPTTDAKTGVVVTHQFVLITAATMLAMAAVADERRGKHKLQQAAQANAQLYASAQRENAERRRAEQHQRLLINELNHRVKNTLATVQSMIGQTLRTAPTPQAALDPLNARILALARAHDVLTEENWEGADLGAVVSAAVAPFAPPQSGRICCEGPRVRLSPSLALALAMAFHELGTNAVKYGALGEAGGQVRIAWRERPGEAGRRVQIEWVESEGPPVEPPARKGFGSRLLERALPAQLHGAVQLDFRPAGLRCEIEANLPSDALLADTQPSRRAG